MLESFNYVFLEEQTEEIENVIERFLTKRVNVIKNTFKISNTYSVFILYKFLYIYYIIIYLFFSRDCGKRYFVLFVCSYIQTERLTKKLNLT